MATLMEMEKPEVETALEETIESKTEEELLKVSDNEESADVIVEENENLGSDFMDTCTNSATNIADSEMIITPAGPSSEFLYSRFRTLCFET